MSSDIEQLKQKLDETNGALLLALSEIQLALVQIRMLLISQTVAHFPVGTREQISTELGEMLEDVENQWRKK